MQANLLFFYTETSLHAGTGSTVSAIDLPIQRERTTQFPNIQGSSIKGSLRSEFQAATDDNNLVEAAFGPATSSASDHAGAVTLGEARVVLFPVRSLLGVFAYVTSPFVINRLRRDAANAGLDIRSLEVPGIENDQCLVTGDTVVSTSNSVILEEFAFESRAAGSADALAGWLAKHAMPQNSTYEAWRAELPRRLVILPDDAFRDFVQNSTEITTHIRIDPETKTVSKGALWTMESVPSEALFVSTVLARRSRKAGVEGDASQLMEWLVSNAPERMQLGGNETTGQGFVAINFAGKGGQ